MAKKPTKKKKRPMTAEQKANLAKGSEKLVRKWADKHGYDLVPK